MKIMCLGDSMTDGFWLEGGYRTTLCSLIEENGLKEKVEFVGINKSGDCYSNAHCGFSSFSIENIPQSVTGGRTGVAAMLDEIFKSCAPDVTLLQIGTNDILSIYRLEEAGVRLMTLARNIILGMNGGRLYIATIPYMDAKDDTFIPSEHFTCESIDKMVDSFNAHVRLTVSYLKHEGYDVRLADINKVMDRSLLHDGVHPSEEGYKKIGTFWFETLNNDIFKELSL